MNDPTDDDDRCDQCGEYHDDYFSTDMSTTDQMIQEWLDEMETAEQQYNEEVAEQEQKRKINEAYERSMKGIS